MGREKVHQIKKAKQISEDASGVDRYVHIVKRTKEHYNKSYHAKLWTKDYDLTRRFVKQMGEELKSLQADEETKLTEFAEFTALFD